MSEKAEPKGKASVPKLVLAAALAILALAVGLAYFLAPLPDKKEEIALERLDGLVVRPSGSLSPLPHDHEVKFEEFKELAQGRRPFLEVSVTQRCLKRGKKGCTSWSEERATARYSVLSPAGDGSWIVSFPRAEFSGAGPWLDFVYAWDIDYDESKVALVRYPVHFKRWLVITAFIVCVVAALATLTGSIPTPPKKEWRERSKR